MQPDLNLPVHLYVESIVAAAKSKEETIKHVPFDLIYLEPSSGGYHTGHCRIFLDRVLEDPRVRSVHFVIGSQFSVYAGADPPELSGHSPKVSCEYLPDELVHYLAQDARSHYRRGFALWKEARRLLTARPGAVCFINFFDPTLFGAVLDRRPLPGVITGIIHFPPFNLNSRKLALVNACRRMVRSAPYYLASYKTMPVVFTFDKYYLDTLPRCIARHWRLVPDPIPLPRQKLRLAFPVTVAGTAHVRTQFLLFGSLGRRKGLGRLLEALRHMDRKDRERMHIVLAGEIREATPAERQQLKDEIMAAKQLPGLLLEHIDRYLSEEDLIQALNACQVVLAPYANHIGVSGVVLWSAAAGKPIVSQDTGWVGHVVKEGRLGLTCDTGSTAALAETLRCASLPETYLRFDPATLQQFARGHSADDFYDAIVSRLAELPS